MVKRSLSMASLRYGDVPHLRVDLVILNKSSEVFAARDLHSRERHGGFRVRRTSRFPFAGFPAGIVANPDATEAFGWRYEDRG
ncbi:hypothetical protein DMH17_02005 [Raoultella planticola]|nr:hypothetical protein [Raoultella planticola]